MKRLALLFLLPLVAWSQSAPLTVFNTVADLLAYTPPVGVNPIRRVVVLRGYNSIGDGGEGQFYYEDPCSENTNYGTIFPLPTYDGAGPVWRRATTASEPINVKWFGAVGNGVAIDSSRVQAAITAARGKTLYVPKGTYLVRSLNLTNDVTIVGDGSGSILRAIPQGLLSTSGSILLAAPGASDGNITNVTLNNLTFWGSVAADDFFSSNQWDHSVSLWGVSDFTIKNCNFRETRGDSIYIGHEYYGVKHNTNILIEGCVFDNSGENTPDGGSETFPYYPMRNGVSVIDGQNVKIVNNEFRYVTAQTNNIGQIVVPGGWTNIWMIQPGPIDVEPNYDYSITRNIHITGNTFSDCGGYTTIGLALRAGQTNNTGFIIANNTLRNCRGSAFLVSDPTAATNDSNVLISGNLVETQLERGWPIGGTIRGRTSYADYGRPFYIYGGNGVKFVNNTWRRTQAAGLMRSLALGYQTNLINNIEFSGNTFEEIGTTTLSATEAAAIKGYLINNVTIENNNFINVGQGGVGYAFWLRGVETNATCNGLVIRGNQLIGADTTYLAYSSYAFAYSPNIVQNKNYFNGNTAIDSATALISSAFQYSDGLDIPKTYLATTGGIDWYLSTTNSGVTNALNASAVPGTAAFTVVTILDIPASNAGIKRIWNFENYNTGSWLPYFLCTLYNNDLRVMCATGGSDYRYARWANFTTTYGGGTIQLAIERNTATDTIAAFVDGEQIEDPVYVDNGTPPDFSTVDVQANYGFSLGFRYGDKADGADSQWAQRIFRCNIFVDNLTGTELGAIADYAGVPAEYKWGAFPATVGCVLDYDLASPNGNLVYDRSTYGQHGTVINSEIVWVNGTHNDALVRSAVATAPATGSGKSAVYAADNGTVTTPIIKYSNGDTNDLYTPTWGTGAIGTLNLTNPLGLDDGGTGASLSDPGADSLMIWDDTDNAVEFATAVSSLTITNVVLVNPITVPNGGTGTNTLVAGNLLMGNGTNFVVSLAGSADQAVVHDGTRWTNSSTINIATLNLGTGTVTNNIFAKIGSGATVADMNLASASDSVSGAIAFTHATNGAASTHKSHVHFLPNWSGGNQTLTIPAAWKTNVYSAVPANLTNGTITVMYVTSFAATGDAANQTNVTVSFEYYK